MTARVMGNPNRVPVSTKRQSDLLAADNALYRSCKIKQTVDHPCAPRIFSGIVRIHCSRPISIGIDELDRGFLADRAVRSLLVVISSHADDGDPLEAFDQISPPDSTGAVVLLVGRWISRPASTSNACLSSHIGMMDRLQIWRITQRQGSIQAYRAALWRSCSSSKRRMAELYKHRC